VWQVPVDRKFGVIRRREELLLHEIHPNRDSAEAATVTAVRRIAQRLAQKRIQPADIIAWSLWRRAHQAAAQKSHLKQKPQL
jgi:hypothetical protein